MWYTYPTGNSNSKLSLCFELLGTGKWFKRDLSLVYAPRVVCPQGTSITLDCQFIWSQSAGVLEAPWEDPFLYSFSHHPCGANPMLLHARVAQIKEKNVSGTNGCQLVHNVSAATFNDQRRHRAPTLHFERRNVGRLLSRSNLQHRQAKQQAKISNKWAFRIFHSGAYEYTNA